MNLQQLTEHARAGEVTSLDLLSLEGGLYLLEVRLAQGAYRLTDEAGRFLRLRSVEHARELLAGLPEVPLYLVHASAYDEMCGLPEGRREPLRVPIALRSAWAG